nr:hypothetical protein CFP56_34728 [Quercus suber]
MMQKGGYLADCIPLSAVDAHDNDSGLVAGAMRRCRAEQKVARLGRHIGHRRIHASVYLRTPSSQSGDCIPTSNPCLRTPIFPTRS